MNETERDPNPLKGLPPLPTPIKTLLGPMPVFTQGQMLAYGESCARMAREEAAKLCDAIYKDEQDEPVCYGFAKECAAAIRKG